jgi:hypothetical protein
MFLSTDGLCQHLSPSASALCHEKGVAIGFVMWDRDEEGAVFAGPPLQNPLVRKGWDKSLVGLCSTSQQKSRGDYGPMTNVIVWGLLPLRPPRPSKMELTVRGSPVKSRINPGSGHPFLPGAYTVGEQNSQ